MAPEVDKEHSAFLQTFPTHFHHRKPESDRGLWVFWNEDEEERYQNQSSSSDVATNPRIFEKIKSVFSDVESDFGSLILQFWVPVTIGGRRLLSTSGQPFAFGYPHTHLAKYRMRSLEYQYNIDDTNKFDITSGAASRAFVNRFPETVNFRKPESVLERYALECQLMTSYVLPICYPSQSSSCCVGVIECSTDLIYDLSIVKDIVAAIENVGLSVFDVKEHIPYKNINGLKPTKDEIEEALEVVCESYNIGLAQVWISFEDENHLPFSSSSLEDTRKKRITALKLTDYNSKAFQDGFREDYYYYSCDMFPLHTGKELVEMTFQDYEARVCKNMSKLSEDMLMACAAMDEGYGCSALVICLRSLSTGDYDYAFEFIWRTKSKYLIWLESLLLTLKRCLPSFKFASGAELGDELLVIDVDNSTTSETQYFKIFEKTIPETLEKGKKQASEDDIAHSERKSKTAEINIPREVIEQQFGNTQKTAANNLNVALSTLKRKCKYYGISEWPGPSVAKRKVNDSCNNQSKNEEDNGAIQNPLAVSKNENTLIIKAEWADDIIKFHLDISQAKFITVEKEIGVNFKLTDGTFKIKYLDEDGDWILLISDQGLTDCIRSSRKLDRTVVRLRVQQSTQPTSGSCEIYHG